LIKVILEDYYTPKILEEAYKFSESGTYHCPEDGPYDKYKGYILGLPLYEKPEVFGLHDNAEISAAIHDANKLCDLVLSLLPRSTGG
jgi:dynein heavy chain